MYQVITHEANEIGSEIAQRFDCLEDAVAYWRECGNGIVQEWIDDRTGLTDGYWSNVA